MEWNEMKWSDAHHWSSLALKEKKGKERGSTALIRLF